MGVSSGIRRSTVEVVGNDGLMPPGVMSSKCETRFDIHGLFSPHPSAPHGSLEHIHLSQIVPMKSIKSSPRPLFSA